MVRWKYILLSLSIALCFGSVHAANIAVPAPLEPWRQWVLDQHRDMTCPPHYASLGERYCRWPERLALQADSSGASFSQDWQLYSDGWITLPGDAENWPQKVQVNDRNVAVIEHDGFPAIHLPAGTHRVQGAFRWNSMPTRLALPFDTGLLALTVQGKPVPQPSIDENGGLLFGENSAPETVADSLSVQVFRQLQDDIPLQMETVVRFRVAGRDRELLLGQLLLDGFVPLALDTQLPARVEQDGRLRVQLRAGAWEVHLRARAEGQPLTFASKKMDESWPEEEIWSLRDNRSLRQISVKGPAAVDPSQTDMPAAWRELPAWLMRASETLVITQNQRGDMLTDAAKSGEELTLDRELWLDFDGGGMTSRDKVTGLLKQAARFTSVPEQLLGRAEVNGQAQLITRLEGQQTAAGIELRPGPLDMLTISRVEQPAHFSATGWQHDFSTVSARLNLPPGWMLLHAAGADSAIGSWLANWNLWAIFLVLIVAATSGRLLGWPAGLVALLALLLTYHSANAPVFFWLAALLGVALVRLLPEGRLRQWLGLYNGLVFVALALLLLTFAVDQARRSFYPQLELGSYANIQQGASGSAGASDNMALMKAAPASAPAPTEEVTVEAQKMSRSDAEDGVADRRMYMRGPSTSPRPVMKMGYDTSANVQTGPGEPAWQWQAVALRWSGPVTQAQTLHLYLLSPTLHRLWNLVSVLLVFVFAGLLLRAAWPSINWRLPGTAITPAVLFFAVVLLQAQPLLAQQLSAQQANSGFPNKELLVELEQRLTRLPECEPQCAAFSRGLLQLDPTNLRLELQLDAQEVVAVPLPVVRNQWQPRTILVDDEPGVNVRRDANGLLWMVLAPGTHRLLLEGPALGDHLQLPFEMPVHNFVVEATGWQVSGLASGQIPGRSLQLTRESQSKQADNESAQLLPDAAPPFLRVTRTLVLGLDWQVQTHVERLAPVIGAISVPVSLLPGEAVLTPGVEVIDGKAQVVMNADSPSFSWFSKLQQNSSLVLTAAQPAPWIERWQFAIAPIWHVDFTGLNPVKQDMQEGQLPSWQPWPGEVLNASISRPGAISGNTRTIESAVLDYRPGSRSAEATLSLQVRSSQGSELPLALPPASQLQRVLIDGIEQANPSQGTPAEGVAVSVPLRPGNQRIDVSWRQQENISWRTTTPQPTIDEPLTNVELKLQMPEGRWLLAVGGPAMGPALLLWGVLLVIVLVALLLGRSRIAPVATWQWLLLGIGMSTVNNWGSILVVLWFVAMARRRELDTARLRRIDFHLLQVGLVFLTVIALSILVGTIPRSLLSTPDMQVVGNQSTAAELIWYQDRMAQGLPTAWVISLPMWVYRAVMLVWSLWLVFSLLGWGRWGWQSFTVGELWRSHRSEETVENSSWISPKKTIALLLLVALFVVYWMIT